MTPIDSIKVGDWIAVSDCLVEPPECIRDHSIRFQADGRPWQVVAISLPFLCLRDDRVQVTLDVRNWEVVRLSRVYVARVLEAPAARERRRKPRKPKADALQCPRCGERMVQMLIGSQWRYTCRDCKFDGGAAPARLILPKR